VLSVIEEGCGDWDGGKESGKEPVESSPEMIWLDIDCSASEVAAGTVNHLAFIIRPRPTRNATRPAPAPMSANKSSL
jgi:hypothetical protein